MCQPCTMKPVVSAMPWCGYYLILFEIGFGGGLGLCFLHMNLEGAKNSGVEYAFC